MSIERKDTGALSSIVPESPAGDFDRALLKAIRCEEYIAGSIPHADVPALVDSVCAVLDREYPELSSITGTLPVEKLVLKCQSLLDREKASPACVETLFREITPHGRSLVELVAEQFDPVRRFLFAETEHHQQGAEIVDLSAASLVAHPDEHDIELIRRILETQDDCVVTEEDRRDPARPVRGGLLSRMSPEDFTEALRAPDAQVLVCKNADTPYGFAIYHGTGSCAAEDREFVGRANGVLSQELHQQEIERVFGKRYDSTRAATAYGVLIDPDIKQKHERGGAETPRGVAYDAMVYYLLNELATSENRPQWVLAWVRTYPNPNLAINAHRRVLFHDTGIEMPFYPDNPDKLKLKLLLLDLDAQFDAEGKIREDVDPGQQQDRESYGNLSLLSRRRMQLATQQVPLTDFDIG